MKILLEGVTNRFGALKALEEVSLEVAPGQIVALLGPNGAGKTTLLRCLGGVVVPDEGVVLYDGQRFHRSRLNLRRRLFFLPDFSPLIPDVDPLRHLGMVLRLYGATSPGVEDRVVEILRELGLLALAELPVSILSRGQAYKAALAGLLAADPEIGLLDEPFASGMDPDGISTFRRRALEAAGRGRIVIYSTRILDVAEDFADRIGVIDRGRLRAFDTLGNLRERFGGGGLEGIFRRIREEGP